MARKVFSSGDLRGPSVYNAQQLHGCDVENREYYRKSPDGKTWGYSLNVDSGELNVDSRPPDLPPCFNQQVSFGGKNPKISLKARCEIKTEKGPNTSKKRWNFRDT